MGLFDLLAEVVTLPLNVATTAVKTTVKIAGAAVTLDPDAAEKAVTDAEKEAIAKLKKLEDSVD